MLYQYKCDCGDWTIKTKVEKPLHELSPRICDCEYCQVHPAAVVSDPDMEILLQGGMTTVKQNGDQQANFYLCRSCEVFLVVGCSIGGVLRGAVNSRFIADDHLLGTPVNIQPRLLSAPEKLERWATLWGLLDGV